MISTSLLLFLCNIPQAGGARDDDGDVLHQHCLLAGLSCNASMFMKMMMMMMMMMLMFCTNIVYLQAQAAMLLCL